MEFGLLPLANVALFPLTYKPLNLFERRYVQLVRDCIDQGRNVAVGFVEDADRVGQVRLGEIPSFVNLIAGYGLPQIVEERSNHSILIFLQGLGRVRIGKTVRVDPYILVEGEVLKEIQIPEESLIPTLANMRRILKGWVEKHVQDPTQREVFLRGIQKPEEIVSHFSTYLVRDYDLQQQILERNDINEQIQMLERIVESNEILS